MNWLEIAQRAIDQGWHTLDLSGNPIGDDDAKTLAAMLPNMQLSTLNLSNTQLSDEGAKAIAAVLPKLQLTRLDLDANQISDAGTIALAATLPSTSITRLGLANNKIGHDGIRELFAILPQTQINKLDVWDNNISDSMFETIRSYLKDRKVHLRSTEELPVPAPAEPRPQVSETAPIARIIETQRQGARKSGQGI